MKGLAVVIHPPGDASQVGSIVMFSGYWAVFDWWKRCLNHKLIKGRWVIVKLHCSVRELSEISYIWLLGLIDWGFWWLGCNHCEFGLESLQDIIRVDYCTTVIVFASGIKEIGQRSTKREWGKILVGVTELGIFPRRTDAPLGGL